MVQSASNPGIPIEVFDGSHSGLTRDRSQFTKTSSAVLWRESSRCKGLTRNAGSVLAVEQHAGSSEDIYDSVKAFSETDVTEDLKKFDVRTLVMYGEDDQIVSINDTGKKSAKLIKGAKEIYYPGLPHGLTATNADQVNADLLASLKSVLRHEGKPNPFPAASRCGTAVV